MRAWADAGEYRRIAAELVRLEAVRGIIDLEALGDDPEAALAQSSELEIAYYESPQAGCSVYGSYHPRSEGPARIAVHPALSADRDAFTIVHEVGHHVQRQHRVWANVRYGFGQTAGERIEERVADAFAAEVLMPASEQADPAWLDARVLAQVHARVRASRSAVAMRAIEIAPPHQQVAVVVANLTGSVIFARGSGDVYSPSRGRVQPGLASLIEAAVEGRGYAEGELTEGVRFDSGWVQLDLHAEVALDVTRAHAFAVIRPVKKYGRSPTWEKAEAECSREACGEVFVVDASVEQCPLCEAARCPQCRGCACEPEAAAVCNRCFMELSVAEQTDPVSHECF